MFECDTKDMDVLFGSATRWLQNNGQVALLSETFVLPSCIPALDMALSYLSQSGVWTGFIYYATGPYFVDPQPSIYVETPNGGAGGLQLDMIVKYSGSGLEGCAVSSSHGVKSLFLPLLVLIMVL